MKLLRVGQAAAVLSIAALGLAACGGSNNPGSDSSPAADSSASTAASAPAADAQVSGTLSGQGSSAQESAVAAWTAGLTAAQPGLQVQYNPVGSGGGRKAFLAGQAAFAGSDAAANEDELKQSQEVCGPDGAFNVPTYIDPVAVDFNLEGVKSLNLDGETIAKIFTGEITSWNDKAIADQNPDATLPDSKITPVHRADDSGTTENFTDYLTAVAPKTWTAGPIQTWPKELKGESAQGTSGVVSPGAIGYADLAAVGDLGVASLKVGDSYQEPTAEAAAKNVALAKPVDASGKDMALTLDRSSEEAGQYPAVLVSYQIFCHTYKDQSTVDMVKAWGSYVVSEEGQKAAADAAGSAPLVAEMGADAAKLIDSITVAG